MFRPVFISAALVITLTACGGGNPFREPTPGPIPEPGGDVTSGITGLPGTATPGAGAPIRRREARASGTGNGYVSDVSYNAVADTFTVEGLAFDGGNVYRRDRSVNLGSEISAYASDALAYDPTTGSPIPQLTHRAVYGKAASGSYFAIVRTGAYVDYGFGGFVYERAGGFSLPPADGAGKRGQGNFTGEYAGLRDFSGPGAPGLEFTRGDMRMAIDFDDFNDGHGVNAVISNRRVYDINGADITAVVAGALPGSPAALPVISFAIGPNVTDSSGEMAGRVVVDSTAAGNYYAVLGGAGATEVVGIIALTPTPDGRTTGVTVRETGGFVLTRN
ncbi:hypothetical protein [Pseudogemmobacter faecipullorum]|uniref:Transferrin-binding protein B C-lobe/N-lobe beta barrel domain-containing protein n=1 Tax=Pseudogemmobacter faecipullorum TaxID=2755041 RepID=A0ABS8CL68_9RHOB|nr:hypothetical protein [Pseudogemmobacter faecipullorum]MCB5409918.1 hypothetical protein [Pseudogemmobacter faecipullorum]